METIEKLLNKNMTSIEEQIFIREWIAVTSDIRRHYLKHGGYVFRNRNIRTNPRKSE